MSKSEQHPALTHEEFTKLTMGLSVMSDDVSRDIMDLLCAVFYDRDEDKVWEIYTKMREKRIEDRHHYYDKGRLHALPEKTKEELQEYLRDIQLQITHLRGLLR